MTTQPANVLMFDPEDTPAPVTRVFEPGLAFDLFPTGRKDRRRLQQRAREQAGGDPARENEIFEDLLRRHMVRGWSGVVGKDGRPLPFSPDLVGPLLDAFSNLEMWVNLECENLAFTEGKRRARQLKN